jgi:hypothetical protein
MKRREFVLSAGLLAGASALPLATHAHSERHAPLWQLLWASSAEAGSAWRPVHSTCIRGCGDEPLQVTMDAFHVAEAGNVVSQLGVRAIFDLASGESVPFLAWQYSGQGIENSSTTGIRFIAGRATLLRFEIDYTHADVRRTEQCGLAGAGQFLLNPGHYLLAGPRADGTLARVEGSKHSGDVMRPLSGSTDFDYLAFRVGSAA